MCLMIIALKFFQILLWCHIDLSLGCLPGLEAMAETALGTGGLTNSAGTTAHHQCTVVLWRWAVTRGHSGMMQGPQQLRVNNDDDNDQGPHHQRHIRCLSRVWSGTTLCLRRTSVQLSKPSDATYSARPVGQPGCGHRLPQPGQLTIGEELLGYHDNNTDDDDP